MIIYGIDIELNLQEIQMSQITLILFGDKVLGILLIYLLETRYHILVILVLKKTIELLLDLIIMILLDYFLINHEIIFGILDVEHDLKLIQVEIQLDEGTVI